MNSTSVEERPISSVAAGVTVVLGLIALLVHDLLVPFFASSGNGLLSNGLDLHVYRSGALKVLHGQALYTPTAGWFTYPPFAALMFTPFTLLTFPVAKYVWFTISVAALALTIWRCLRVAGYRRDHRLGWFCLGLSAAAVEIDAVSGALSWGQVVFVLMAIIVWDLTRAPDARLRGWSVGVAIGVKLTAVVFVPYLLITRQWRAAATSIGATTATVLLGFLARPADSREYWLHAAYQIHHVGNPDDVGNWSVNGVLANVWSPGSVPGWVLLACTLAAGILGLTAASSAHRQGWTLLAVTIMGMASCATSPLAWGHQWVWFAPLLTLLLLGAMHAHHDHRPVVPGVLAMVTLAGLTAMWTGVWTYFRIRQLGITHLVSSSKLDIAVGHERWLRIMICGLPLLIYISVALFVLLRDRMTRTDFEVDQQASNELVREA